MTAPPPGISCSTCDFFWPSKNECHILAPLTGGGPSWPNVEPDDWCAHHNLWPQTMGGAHSWGQPSPTGGENNDYYTQYQVIRSGNNNYVNKITFWQNQNGVWSQTTSIQDPWP